MLLVWICVVVWWWFVLVGYLVVGICVCWWCFLCWWWRIIVVGYSLCWCCILFGLGWCVGFGYCLCVYCVFVSWCLFRSCWYFYYWIGIGFRVKFGCVCRIDWLLIVVRFCWCRCSWYGCWGFWLFYLIVLVWYFWLWCWECWCSSFCLYRCLLGCLGFGWWCCFVWFGRLKCWRLVFCLLICFLGWFYIELCFWVVLVIWRWRNCWCWVWSFLLCWYRLIGGVRIDREGLVRVVIVWIVWFWCFRGGCCSGCSVIWLG